MRRRPRPIVCGKDCQASVPGASAGVCILVPGHEGECADAVCVTDFSAFQRVAEVLLRGSGGREGGGG
jgi:hypothetical protein